MRTIDLAEALPAACRRYPSVFKTATGDRLDRSKSIGASELWNCERQIVFRRQDIDGKGRDEGANEGLGYFERGHAVEARFMARLGQAIEESGLALVYTGEEQVSIRDSKARMHATPDGLLVNRNPGPGVEINGIRLNSTDRQAINIETKSLDPRSNLSKVRDGHAAQCQLQMAMWGHLDWDARHTIMFYVDASDYMRFEVHVIEQDPDFLKRARERVGRIWDLIDNGAPIDAEAEGKWDGTCSYCDYQDACGEAVLSYQPLNYAELGPVPLMDMQHELKVRQVSVGVIAHETRRKLASEQAIRGILREAGTNLALAGGKKIAWQQVAGRRTLDRDAVGACLYAYGDDIENDEYWKTGKPSERLVIKDE